VTQFRDITGQRFGWVTVIDFAYRRKRIAYWNVRCDCGKTKAIALTRILKDRELSCRQCAWKRAAVSRTEHGMSDTAVHISWNNHTQNGTMCEEWKDFNAFMAVFGYLRKGECVKRIDTTKPLGPDNWYIFKRTDDPEIDVDEIKASTGFQRRILLCVARARGATMQHLAAILGITKQRVLQLSSFNYLVQRAANYRHKAIIALRRVQRIERTIANIEKLQSDAAREVESRVVPKSSEALAKQGVKVYKVRRSRWDLDTPGGWEVLIKEFSEPPRPLTFLPPGANLQPPASDASPGPTPQ
jgi:hypothetical protein